MNLMDMNHQLLHRKLMGRILTIPLVLRERTGTVEVDYTFQRSSGKQHIGERSILSAAQNSEGGHDLLTICTDYAY